MTIPKPNKYERIKKFIPRCLSDKMMKKEFPWIKQRLAICFRRGR